MDKVHKFLFGLIGSHYLWPSASLLLSSGIHAELGGRISPLLSAGCQNFLKKVFSSMCRGHGGWKSLFFCFILGVRCNSYRGLRGSFPSLKPNTEMAKGSYTIPLHIPQYSVEKQGLSLCSGLGRRQNKLEVRPDLLLPSVHKAIHSTYRDLVLPFFFFLPSTKNLPTTQGISAVQKEHLLKCGEDSSHHW